MNRYIAVILILLLALVVNYLPASPPPTLVREPLKDFPTRLGDWTLVSQQKMDPGSLRVLKVDDYIMRTYRDDAGQTVSLYIGWFHTQKEGKQNHSPRECLTGAGWYTIKADPTVIRVAPETSITVNRYYMQNGPAKDLFLFWYQGRGRESASEYLTKFYLALDSITKHRTDGALIRLNSSAASGQDKALRTETAFIRCFYPLLSKYIPN